MSYVSPLYCSYLAAAPIPQKPPSPTEAPTPMYGKRPLLNIRVAGALIAYQMLSRAALGKDWSCSDKYRLSIARA